MTIQILNGREATSEVAQAEPVTALPAPEEVLIADPRGDLTPAQRVQEKLLVLLQTSKGMFSVSSAGRLHDIRQIPGAR